MAGSWWMTRNLVGDEVGKDDFRPRAHHEQRHRGVLVHGVLREQ